MIKIDIALAISLFLNFALCIVFIFWIFYTWIEKRKTEDSASFHQCPYCIYLFFEETDQEVITCPRCKSLLEGRSPTKR